MRVAVTPTWLTSKCAASCFSTFSTFHTTASASNSEPSWNFTPGRSLKIHLVWSLGDTAHSVATPGITTLALSADERSHVVSPSYIVLPVKRLPSKPWSGWPTVFGISAAVMPMRTTDCADAAVRLTASSAAASGAAVINKPVLFIANLPIGRVFTSRTVPSRPAQNPVHGGCLSPRPASGCGTACPQIGQTEISLGGDCWGGPESARLTLRREGREGAGIGLGQWPRVAAALGRPETNRRKSFGQNDCRSDTVDHRNTEFCAERGRKIRHAGAAEHDRFRAVLGRARGRSRLRSSCVHRRPDCRVRAPARRTRARARNADRGRSVTGCSRAPAPSAPASSRRRSDARASRRRKIRLRRSRPPARSASARAASSPVSSKHAMTCASAPSASPSLMRSSRPGTAKASS